MLKAMVRVAASVVVALVLCVPAAEAGDQVAGKRDPAVMVRRAEGGREAKIRVLVPTPDAKLWFDDTLTTGTGGDRSFLSPPLEEGKTYTYRVTIVWRENG